MRGIAPSTEAGRMGRDDQLQIGFAEQELTDRQIIPAFTPREVDLLLDDQLDAGIGAVRAEERRFEIARVTLDRRPEGDFAYFAKKYFDIIASDKPPREHLIKAAMDYAWFREKIDVTLCEFPEHADSYSQRHIDVSNRRRHAFQDIVKRSEFVEALCEPAELDHIGRVMTVRVAEPIEHPTQPLRIPERWTATATVPLVERPKAKPVQIAEQTFDHIDASIQLKVDELNKQIDAAAPEDLSEPKSFEELEQQAQQGMEALFETNAKLEGWLNDTSEGRRVGQIIFDSSVSDQAVLASLQRSVQTDSYKQFAGLLAPPKPAPRPKPVAPMEPITESLPIVSPEPENPQHRRRADQPAPPRTGQSPQTRSSKPAPQNPNRFMPRPQFECTETADGYHIRFAFNGVKPTTIVHNLIDSIDTNGRKKASLIATTAAMGVAASMMADSLNTPPLSPKAAAAKIEPRINSPAFKTTQAIVQGRHGAEKQITAITIPDKLIDQSQKKELIIKSFREVIALASQPPEHGPHAEDSRLHDKQSFKTVEAIDNFAMGILSQLYDKPVTYKQFEKIQLQLARAMYAARYPKQAEADLPKFEPKTYFEYDAAHYLSKVFFNNDSYSEVQKTAICGALAQALVSEVKSDASNKALENVVNNAVKAMERVTASKVPLHHEVEHILEGHDSFMSPRIGYGISPEGRRNLRLAIAKAAHQTGVDPDFIAAFYYAENARLDDATNNADSASGVPVTGNGIWRDPPAPWGHGAPWSPLNEFAAAGGWQIIPETWNAHKPAGMNNTTDTLNLYDSALVAARYLQSLGAGKYSSNNELYQIAFAYNHSDTYAQSVMNTYHYLKSFQEPKSQIPAADRPYQLIRDHDRSFWISRNQRLLKAAFKFNPDSYSESMIAGHYGPQVYWRDFHGFGPNNLIDCSGLINMSIWDAFGVSLAENTETELADKRNFIKVKFSDLLPGDLIMPYNYTNPQTGIITPEHVELVTGVSGSKIYTFGAHRSEYRDGAPYPQALQVGPTFYEFNPSYIFLRYVGPDHKHTQSHTKYQTDHHSFQTNPGKPEPPIFKIKGSF